MTEYRNIDFTDLVASANDEIVTHSYVRDVRLPSGKNLALITLDNGRDHTRPSTLGPRTLTELSQRLDELSLRAKADDIQAVAITGKPYFLAAGADLSKVSEIPDKEFAIKIAQLGHATLGKLGTLGVPSFCFINGLALGGGLEIALNSDYRTVNSNTPAIALPEVFLGLVPGWGGAYLLPNLIGIENALKVIIENPLKNNRTLKAVDALALGIVDVMFSPVNFLEDSLRWADQIISGKLAVKRSHIPGKIERLAKWDVAVGVARRQLEGKLGNVPVAPYAALELLKQAKSGTKTQAFTREDKVLGELISGDQFQASIYAFNLVQKRAKKPAGAPDKELARKITKVGIIGAGLMASQFALLFVRRLQVPVIITDLDQAKVTAGISRIADGIDLLKQKGRIDADDANRLRRLISGTTNRKDFADCDWVIEAVFEDLAVKQKVFADIEPHLSSTAIIATNTSSLSVSKIGTNLTHPERLIGFHFFNPVAVMPLIEVAKAENTDQETLATAVNIAAKLRKNAVITADAPGFVVNRLLAKVMGEAARAVDEGTPLAIVERSLAPIGLPMGPFELIDLVGWGVAAHVQDSMAAAFPERFYASPNLHRVANLKESIVEKDKHGKVTSLSKSAIAAMNVGSGPTTASDILRRVEDEIAKEIQLMLEEKVVSAVEDIDLCLILGAGWPFQAGGITPYLDRVGASERVTGATFHNPPIQGVH